MEQKKKCAHCKETKPIEEFAYSNRILKTRQKHCRDCMSRFNKNSYAKKGEQEKRKIYDNRKKRAEVAKQYIWDYLSTHPCVDCGESDPLLLEFDHKNPSNKKDNVSNMANGKSSIETIQKEIDKCVVRCVSCHRRKTAKEQGWFQG
jgi:hypothetical protein